MGIRTKCCSQTVQWTVTHLVRCLGAGHDITKSSITQLLLDMETQSSCQKFHFITSGTLVRIIFINHFELSFRTLNLILDFVVCNIYAEGLGLPDILFR
jgi:hypothetical protein